MSPIEATTINSSPYPPGLDARTIQLLTSLVGRVEDLEKGSTDLSPYALLNYVNNMLPIGETVKVTSISDDLSIRNADPSLIVIHGNYEARTITLPGNNKGNKFYVIINDGA